MALSIWVDRLGRLSDGLSEEFARSRSTDPSISLTRNLEGMKMTHLAHRDIPAIPLILIIIILVATDDQVSPFRWHIRRGARFGLLVLVVWERQTKRIIAIRYR